MKAEAIFRMSRQTSPISIARVHRTLGGMIVLVGTVRMEEIAAVEEGVLAAVVDAGAVDADVAAGVAAAAGVGVRVAATAAAGGTDSHGQDSPLNGMDQETRKAATQVAVFFT